jgi:hypothetical protein
MIGTGIVIAVLVVEILLAIFSKLALVIVNPVNAAGVPTAPPSVTIPVPATKANVCAPVTVPVIEIGPFPADEFKITFPANVIFPPIEIPMPTPLVVIVLATEVIPVPVVKLANAVVPPTTPVNVIVPVEFKVNACRPAIIPSTVPLNVIAPVPDDSVGLTANITASPNVMAPFVVILFVTIDVVPPAFVVKPVNGVVPPITPPNVVGPVEFNVNV